MDDFLDKLTEGSPSPSKANRATLPTPKTVRVSPLKKYEYKKITTRRKVTKWSSLEEETLRAGVRQYEASLTSSDFKEITTQGLVL